MAFENRSYESQQSGMNQKRDRCLQQTTPNRQMKNTSEVFQSIPSMVHESRNIATLDDVGFLESFQ
jgi:hypothetical protein